jgi:lipopolysaccharide export system protein LptA
LEGKTNDVQSAMLMGGTRFQTSGASTMSGSSDSITMAFGSRNLVNKVHAQGNVHLLEPPKPGGDGQTMELASSAMDFWVRNGRQLQRAETSENARVTLTPVVQNARNGGPTVITATKFYTRFGAQNRISSMIGTPGARVVSYTPGQPAKISTSRDIEVLFAAKGGAERVIQRGNFEYHEPLPRGGQRAAWAQSADYSPRTQWMTLSGQPRIIEGGMTTTAHEVRLNRNSGEAFADADVKTTYSELKPQPGGAMQASGAPIHVTASSMVAQRSSNVARYAGNARLWQGPNIIQAPTIDFDRARGAVVAKADGAANGRNLVTSVLLQQGRKGKQTPVRITSSALVYVDPQHVAHYMGHVVVRSADGTVTAEKIDVHLKAREAGASTTSVLSGLRTSRVERIVAQGGVRLLQSTREAAGEHLVYNAAEDKFVLTGGTPTMTDAEHGRVQGASLTFYNGNDRVVVESGGSSRTLTNTRVPERVSK